MVSLGWIRIINRALLPVKNECDTSIVLQQGLVSEMSWALGLNDSTRLFSDFPESSGDILCSLCCSLCPWGHWMNTIYVEWYEQFTVCFILCLIPFLLHQMQGPCTMCVMYLRNCIVSISLQQSHQDKLSYSAFVLLTYNATDKWIDWLV